MGSPWVSNLACVASVSEWGFVRACSFFARPNLREADKKRHCTENNKNACYAGYFKFGFNFCLVYLHLQKAPVSIVTSRQPIVNDNNNINNNNNNLYVCNIIVVLVNDNCFYHNNLEELRICALLSMEFASSDLH